MSADPHKQTVYDAEYRAFDMTALGDRFTASAIVAETNTILDSSWWSYLGVGRPTVSEARVDMTSCMGWADGNDIRYWAGQVNRSVIVHELAHYVAKCLGVCDRHGSSWRAIYVSLVKAVYGAEYADALADEFRLAGLSIARISIAVPDRTVYPLNDDGVRGGWVPPFMEMN